MKDRKNQERGLAQVSHFFLSGPEVAKEKVTIQLAAKTLGVSKGTIINYLNNGLLTRIKEGGLIYISMDEVRALEDKNRKGQVKSSVSASAESKGKAAVSREKDGSKQPLASLGLLENERQYLLQGEAALAAKDKELDTLTLEMNKLKRNLEIQASALKGAETRLRELEKEKQEWLVYLKKATKANDQEREEPPDRLLAVDDELQNLRHPWWKELFAHLRQRPERSWKNGLVFFGAIAFLAVLIFSGWWFNRSSKQPRLPMTEGQASWSGTIQAASHAVLDSDLQQEQAAGVVQQPSEPLQTTVAPESETSALKAQTPQPYSSNVEGSVSSEERVSSLPDADQQVVGLLSTPPPYVLRAETLALTWLQVVIDEREELEYLLQPKEKHTWESVSGFRLHIGNAAGLQLYLNDQPLKPLGKSGEVVHLQLPDPSQIVTADPEYIEIENRP
jgi:hypothetical protein